MSECLHCGACCAFFRVSFHWSESEPFLGGTVPAELTEQITPARIAMRGTSCRQPRCIALEGIVGEQVNCTIYAERPSTCREFEEGSAECNRARASRNLPALPDQRLPRPA